MKSQFALLMATATLALITQAHADTVPALTWNDSTLCAGLGGANPVCAVSKPFPQNTSVSYTNPFSPGGSASASASASLGGESADGGSNPPSVTATASATGNTFATAGVELSYYIRYVPLVEADIDDPISVGVESSGFATANSQAFISIYGYSSFTQSYADLVYFAQLERGTLSVGNGRSFEVPPTPGQDGFELNSDVVLHAENIYIISVDAAANADSSHPSETAAMDPYFTVPAGYTLEISSGVINAPLQSTTPLPAALPLFVTGLGGLGLMGWRRKRKALTARLNT